MQEREARRLATKVSKAFTFCPPIDVWVESLLPLDHPDHVEHAITRLVQSSDTGKEIGVGAVLGEYWRLVRRNVPDTGPGCRVWTSQVPRAQSRWLSDIGLVDAKKRFEPRKADSPRSR